MNLAGTTREINDNNGHNCLLCMIQSIENNHLERGSDEFQR